ncbi:MAG TPA: GMC oxidoreductase [Terracidiphilus sp.]|nr:GMC oxidoreductase [Terracidiphilus sp.]
MGCSAETVVEEPRYAHLVGAAPVGSSPDSSAVDKFSRTHDIANLFICDESILPTQGSANPGLTIQTLAARTADYLIEQGDSVFFSNRRTMQEPRIRYDLSPPLSRFDPSGQVQAFVSDRVTATMIELPKTMTS